MVKKQDTIYALSTPPGKSAIAVVRISGNKALDYIKKISSSMPSKPNTSVLNKLITKTGDVIAVPGKVLGAGVIEHSITIGAVSFSETAKVKIKNAGGTVMLIEKLVETNPDGKGVKIFVG